MERNDIHRESSVDGYFLSYPFSISAGGNDSLKVVIRAKFRHNYNCDVYIGLDCPLNE